jgi:hypothetical protein
MTLCMKYNIKNRMLQDSTILFLHFANSHFDNDAVTNSAVDMLGQQGNCSAIHMSNDARTMMFQVRGVSFKDLLRQNLPIGIDSHHGVQDASYTFRPQHLLTPYVETLAETSGLA